MTQRLIILTIGIVGVSGPPAYAASVTWDGGGGDLNWQNALNWNADTLPGPGDDVVIPDLSPDITITYSLVSSINSLTSPEAMVISGGSLDVAAASTINAPLTISGGVLTGAGDLTVAGQEAFFCFLVENALRQSEPGTVRRHPHRHHTTDPRCAGMLMRITTCVDNDTNRTTERRNKPC